MRRFRPAQLRVEALEDRTTPTTYTVNVATDSVSPADFLTGVGSSDTGDLRYCIAQAEAHPGADTIVFSLPSNSTIALAQMMRPITDAAGLTIRGDTATNLTVSGGNAVRVFFVTNDAVLGINDLTIANGLAKGGNGSDGGGGGAGLGGGMLIDSGTVTLTNVTFSNNQAVGGNGAAPGALGGGGGGAGGNAAPVGIGTSGGGGFLGNGGPGDPGSVSSGGGGGGFTGTGGAGHNGAAGGDGTAIGGGGGSGTPGGTGSTGGGNGSSTGGGGGGSAGFAGSSSGTNGNSSVGGNGGFGGGGGGGNFGGDGGAYGGGGGAGQVGGDGGFGGGGGDGNNAGAGGFGGGGGGGQSAGGSGGQFGGNGAAGHYGGGGAGLGGAIFQRAGNLILINTTFNNNTATGGSGGGGGATGGQGKGGALFINSGATAHTFATTVYSSNSAADAGSTFTNPQDNARVFGTLISGGTLTATAGTPQATAASTAFGQNLQVTLLDSDNNPVAGAVVTFSAPGSGASATFPSGSTFVTDANGQVSVPVTANGTLGDYSVQAAFAGLTAIFSLTNGQPPSITSADATTFTTGTAGSFTVTATGSPAPTFSLTSAPAWLSINPTTGELTGTPPSLGAGPYAFTFTVTATNGVGTDDAQSFTLTVDQAPAITSADATTFTAGAAGSFTVTATGFPAPTFAVTAGALPPGVTLSPTGVLSGTPTAGTTGTFVVTITASNGVGTDASQVFTLTVNQTPVFTSPATAAFVAAAAGSFTVAAIGSPTPVLAITDGTLPPGMTFDPATGVIAGTPEAAGTFTLTVRATNTAGATDQALTLTVAQVHLTATGTVPGGGPRVVVRNADGSVRYDFYAFDPASRGGVSVAVADLNGDGVDDIIAGAGAGGAPHVKVFDGRTGQELASFFAFDPASRGGVSVGAADLDLDGTPDIVTGAGAGGAPHVKVFNGRTGQELTSFFAFDPSFRGGVNVASGDLNGDGKAELVLGAGAGGGPVVSVFDGATGTRVTQFFAGPPSDRGGVEVAVKDLDGNGSNELVTRAAGTTKVFDPLTGTDLTTEFTADQLGGVFVG